MDEQTTPKWKIHGMDCAACTLKVQNALSNIEGVADVKVSLLNEQLSLRLVSDQVSTDQIEAVVKSLGYKLTAITATGAKEEPKPRWYHSDKGRLVVLTGAILAIAWAVEVLISPQYGYYAFILGCLIGLIPVARRAWAALTTGQPFTIESLMTIAALGALCIGAAEEAALVVFLFAVGELLEGVAANQARQSVRALANLVPRVALVEANGDLISMPAEDVEIDQIVMVRPGDRIPADGEIIQGQGGVDESPVTGESMPQMRGPGDAVFAGSINTDTALRIRVTREASDNTIARIIRLVEEAEESRAPTQRFIDRFALWYMPAIVLLALAVCVIPPLAFNGEWRVWLYRGLALLLIGCPCALVISVPASLASALSLGARRGILMKGGAVIEAAAKTKTIAFDKTGTLTHGKPALTDILPAAPFSKPDLLALAAAVEANSSHPLAKAIFNYSVENAVEIPVAAQSNAISGKGVMASVQGENAWVCSPSYSAELGGITPEQLQLVDELESQGKTVVAVFKQNIPYGLIALRDEPRASAAPTMHALKALGITPLILTGDNQRTAKAIAVPLDIDYRAQMLPQDKLDMIRTLSDQGAVMMIGDGINDAPALKQADVGVAIGSGTDVALETADAALMRDRIEDVPVMIELARACMRNIGQNITLALGLKAVFLVTSILGYTGLWVAILADTGATVLVTLNALRLLRFTPK